jgi:hypothetical protein
MEYLLRNEIDPIVDDRKGGPEHRREHLALLIFCRQCARLDRYNLACPEAILRDGNVSMDLYQVVPE